MEAKKRVLFLCTGNSARSQMAEGLLRQMAGDRFEVFSAGTEPKGLHPQTIVAMKNVDIDVSQQRSKPVSEFDGEKFDFVVTVCDRAKDNCPVFPGSTPIHWEFDDPAAAPSDLQAKVFSQVRDEIRRKLQMFLLTLR